MMSYIKYLVIYLFLFSATSVKGQDFIDPEAFRQYLNSIEHMKCDEPQNKDRWAIREPTEKETLLFGSGILVFEYWNSKSRCSDDQYIGVWFGDLRFKMEVITGGKDDPREKITLQTMDTPYHLPQDRLILDDGEEPGKLILYPMIM